jgi:hypothetical protein
MPSRPSRARSQVSNTPDTEPALLAQLTSRNSPAHQRLELPDTAGNSVSVGYDRFWVIRGLVGTCLLAQPDGASLPGGALSLNERGGVEGLCGANGSLALRGLLLTGIRDGKVTTLFGLLPSAARQPSVRLESGAVLRARLHDGILDVRSSTSMISLRFYRARGSNSSIVVALR